MVATEEASLEGFRKGMAWINGHALGRFWHIGPQQTLYCPGCWLKKGTNTLVVLDLEIPTKATVTGRLKTRADASA